MAVSIKHSFECTIPDGANPAQVQPTNWNEEHTITSGAKTLLGRAAISAGEIGEITIGSGLDLNDAGVLSAAASGGTNLGNTPTAANVAITSSTGSDTTVPAATAALAGVMTAADKAKLDAIQATLPAGTVQGAHLYWNAGVTPAWLENTFITRGTNTTVIKNVLGSTTDYALTVDLQSQTSVFTRGNGIQVVGDLSLNDSATGVCLRGNFVYSDEDPLNKIAQRTFIALDIDATATSLGDSYRPFAVYHDGSMHIRRDGAGSPSADDAMIFLADDIQDSIYLGGDGIDADRATISHFEQGGANGQGGGIAYASGSATSHRAGVFWARNGNEGDLNLCAGNTNNGNELRIAMQINGLSNIIRTTPGYRVEIDSIVDTTSPNNGAVVVGSTPNFQVGIGGGNISADGDITLGGQVTASEGYFGGNLGGDSLPSQTEAVSLADSPIICDPGRCYVVDTSGGDVSAILPIPSPIIKDAAVTIIKETTDVNVITVSSSVNNPAFPAGTSIVSTAGDSSTFRCDGIQWWRV